MKKPSIARRLAHMKHSEPAPPQIRLTKQAQVIAMLRRDGGATIAAIAEATKWQPHSIRGFLAGVVRKKLALQLTSEVTDAGRVYRIVEGASA